MPTKVHHQCYDWTRALSLFMMHNQLNSFNHSSKYFFYTVWQWKVHNRIDLVKGWAKRNSLMYDHIKQTTFCARLRKERCSNLFPSEPKRFVDLKRIERWIRSSNGTESVSEQSNNNKDLRSSGDWLFPIKKGSSGSSSMRKQLAERLLILKSYYYHHNTNNNKNPMR